MNQAELADRLFPGVTRLPQEVLDSYPTRDLPEGALVTRFAPSPTGFMTIGGLYATQISERMAHQKRRMFSCSRYWASAGRNTAIWHRS